jgi:hypothetical protein
MTSSKYTFIKVYLEIINKYNVKSNINTIKDDGNTVQVKTLRFEEMIKYLILLNVLDKTYLRLNVVRK